MPNASTKMAKAVRLDNVYILFSRIACVHDMCFYFIFIFLLSSIALMVLLYGTVQVQCRTRSCELICSR